MSEAAGMDASSGAVEGAVDNAGIETEAGSQDKSGEGGSTSTAPSGKEKAAIAKDVVAELQGQDLDKVVKVKINGKEQTLKIRDALKKVELAEGAQAKMQEAARVKQEAMQMLQLAKSNPKSFFKQTGIDPYEFAEATLAEKYEMMAMTPEQRELQEYRAQKAQQDAAEKSSRQEIISKIERLIGKDNIPPGAENATKEQLLGFLQAKTQEHSNLRTNLEQEIVEAWKESGLPKSKYFAARISHEMLSSLAQKKAGLRDEALQAKEAAAIVKEQVTSELREILLQVAKADPGAAQQLLGDEMMKLLRDYDVRRVTGASQASQSKPQQRPGTSSPASGKSQANRPLSEKEWNDYFRKL